jgi:DNA-binding NtrC family response regulator
MLTTHPNLAATARPAPSFVRPARWLPPAAAATELACPPLVGRSDVMQQLYHRMHRVTSSLATVVITGETGTGKELVARALHDGNPARPGAFVAVNCGAIPTTLIESELFGHEKGSFTGANRRHDGVFAQAEHGTLFLDEITEMGAEQQVRLLRVLESGTFQRLGGEDVLHSDVRVLAACNRDPLTEVRNGRLREDLYYRLAVVALHLPPLRERGHDILLLARHFLDRLNLQHGTTKAFAAHAEQHLLDHAWPGNVRELRHCVEQSYLMYDDAIDIDAPTATAARRGTDAEADADTVTIPIGASLADAEARMIQATMIRCEGNKSRAATMLGISLKTLYCRLNLYAAMAAIGA